MNREEANQLKVTQLNDKSFRFHLEECLQQGKVRTHMAYWLLLVCGVMSRACLFPAPSLVSMNCMLLRKSCATCCMCFMAASESMHDCNTHLQCCLLYSHC